MGSSLPYLFPTGLGDPDLLSIIPGFAPEVPDSMLDLSVVLPELLSCEPRDVNFSPSVNDEVGIFGIPLPFEQNIRFGPGLSIPNQVKQRWRLPGGG